MKKFKFLRAICYFILFNIVGVALRIKELSPYENTFVAAHTNSTMMNYAYAPTAEQYNGWDMRIHIPALHLNGKKYKRKK